MSNSSPPCAKRLSLTFSDATVKDFGYPYNARFLALLPDERGQGMAIGDGWEEYEIPQALWDRWVHHDVVDQIVQDVKMTATPKYCVVLLDTHRLEAFIMGEHEANLLCAKQHTSSAELTIKV